MNKKMAAALLMRGRHSGRPIARRALRATGDETMTQHEARALFYGDFSIEAQDHVLVQLADEYHQRTEAFDRTVCTGPMGHDGIMPANHRQLALINANAQRIRRELVDRAVQAGFTEAQFKEAMMHSIRRGAPAIAAAAARQDRPEAWVRDYDVDHGAHHER